VDQPIRLQYSHQIKNIYKITEEISHVSLLECKIKQENKLLVCNKCKRKDMLNKETTARLLHCLLQNCYLVFISLDGKI